MFLKFSKRLFNLRTAYRLKPNYIFLKQLLGLFRLHVQPYTAAALSGKGSCCLFLRRKKNNFYMTLTTGSGAVVFSLSSGSYLLKINEGKRNKKLRASFRHFQEFLKKFINKLKGFGIQNIKYFLRIGGFRRRISYQIIYTFLARGITIENVLNVHLASHSKLTKRKKLRRL